MAPLAVMLAPDPFPLRFTEVVAFRGDFDNIKPHELVCPKGIAYSAALDRVLVSLTPEPDGSGRQQLLTAVGRDGSRLPFAPSYRSFTDVESLLAIVPAAGAPIAAGFAPGEVFVGRGPTDQISRLSSTGNVIADLFVDLGTGQWPWGGLTFDTYGAFGGRLIVQTDRGKILLVGADGSKSQLADLGRRLEGLEVAPAGFGPLAGQIIVGVEGFSDTDPESGKVYAIDTHGNLTLLADIGFAAEDIRFVPQNGGTYYQTELCFDRESENRVLSVSSSQFLSRLGRMLVVNELGGELWEVAWDGARYTQAKVGRAPGRWSSQGFNVQGTELEAGCFAVRSPSLPGWTNWSAVPGGGTTDRAPASAVDYSGNLHLLVKGINDRRIYMNNMVGATQAWSGWAEVPPGGMTTNHTLATAMHDNVLYAFSVRDDGAIMYKPLFDGDGPLLDTPWAEVPGAGRTDAAIAAATANGRLVLSAKGIQDQQIYLNELAPGGRSWSGWFVTPGGGETNAGPGLAAFQDELYVLIKGLTSGHILTKVRTTDGNWTDWAQIPGAGVTDAAIAAVSVSDQLYLFAKGINDRAPYWNVASGTGTWGLWNGIPNGGTTDAAFAVTNISERLYLFAKGIDDRQLYMRHTL